MVSFQTLILTRDESRNPRLKAEGKDFGPLARLFFTFGLQPSTFSLFIYKNGRLNFLFFVTGVQE
jgi:hypothetical protein